MRTLFTSDALAVFGVITMSKSHAHRLYASELRKCDDKSIQASINQSIYQSIN